MKINEFVKVMKNVKMQSEQLAEKLKKMLENVNIEHLSNW